MNLIKIRGLKIEQNNNENYSFSVGGRQVLCLNKRIVEIGVGGCLAFSVYNNKFVDVNYWSSKLSIGVGLVSTFKVSGYNGCMFTLLMSTFLQFSGEFDLRSSIALPFIIGQSLILASGLCAFSVGLSFLIKRFGSDYLNTLLERFNKQQDRISLGAVDLKNNLKYQFSILGKDILCLKKEVIQIGTVIGIVLAFAIELSFEGHISAYWTFFNYIIGALSVYNILGNKIYIPIALVALNILFDKKVIASYYLFAQVCGFIMQVIGEGILLTGTCFGASALVSFLAKKSGNVHLMKLKAHLDKLKDKEKVKEYEKSIQVQKTHLEKRREYFNRQESLINDNIDTPGIWEQADTGIKVRRPRKEERDQGKTGNNEKREVTVDNNKKVDASDLEAKKTYKVNLTGTSKTTWDQLFDITKSKPEHLTIKGRDIKTLITALGGSTEEKDKRIHVLFDGKRLGFYEVRHGKDKSKLLTAKYAQRVKIAIEKAIDSGYIEKEIVELLK